MENKVIKQSEALEIVLADLKKKEDDLREKAFSGDGDFDDKFDKFWNGGGKALSEQIKETERRIFVEKNREIEVGDGVTYQLYTDSYACTVIKRTPKTITIQRDKATLSPDFKPKFIPGGFSAHCTNNEEQSYTYERDPNGDIYVCHWSEKEGRFRSGSDGSFKIRRGRHEFYDYNF